MNELPTTFGKYYLTEKLAVGGMAEIYLAKLIGPGGFEKQLIIKQIHPELSGESQFVDLFVREAKTLVSLTHGNIVPIYELGVVEDRYFIAMEYIDGPTLSRLQTAVRKADARIAPHIAAFIGAELLKGLDYAHRRGDGVIHRDLSPRNVMISRDGEVKLVDFGIAVGLDQQKTQSQERPEGSFPYMSPEQVRGEALTGQSDLFSAGVLLWESLTGEALFLRKTVDETLEAVLGSEIPAPSEAAPEARIPAALDEICARALSRDPADRFASAGDFSSRLNRYLYSQDEPVSPAMVARLVARHCPPVAHPSPAEEPLGDVTPATRTHDADASDAVDRTVPLARGKSRAGTQSFATNVHFESHVLSNATPLFPINAIRDDDDEVANSDDGDDNDDDDVAKSDDAREDQDAPAATESRQAARKTAEPDADGAERTVHIERSGGRRWLAILGALLAIGAGATYLVLRGGGGAAEQPASYVYDAAPTLRTTTDAAVPDASVGRQLDAAVPDAAPPDARKRVPRRRPDAAIAARGKATLIIGANPWAQVYLGKKKLGRAPGEFTIPSGKHTVRVVFPPTGEEKRFRIKVKPDARSRHFADFTDK